MDEEKGKMSPDFDLDFIDKGDIQNELNDISGGNTFPVQAFPQAVQGFINECQRTLRYPVDFMGGSILSVAATAIGNSTSVEVMPGWNEGAVLWIAIVGRPGTGKTHPTSMAIRPLIISDRAKFEQFKHDRANFEEWSNLTPQERKAIPSPGRPVLRKTVVSDITPEAIGPIHQANPRSLLYHRDELAGLLKDFGKYHSGRSGEQEFHTSCWSLSPIIIDRKNSDPVRIARPHIGILGGIQPAILPEINKDGRGENGFLDRILFCYPENLQKEAWSTAQMDLDKIDQYDILIMKLLDIELRTYDDGDPYPTVIKFTEDARKRLFQWQEKNTALSNGVDEEHIASMYSKLEVACVRISLILQLLKWAAGEGGKDAITIDSVEGAIEMTEYFRTTATRVRDIIYDPVGALPKNKQFLFDALPDSFTTGQGIEIAESLGIPERNFRRFLKRRNLFVHFKHGEYKKKLLR